MPQYELRCEIHGGMTLPTNTRECPFCQLDAMREATNVVPMENLSVRVSSELMNKARTIANKQRVSVSFVVREWLTKGSKL